MVFRTLKLEDLPMLLAVERLSAAQPWSEDSLRESLLSTRSLNVCLTEEPEGDIIAYAICNLVEDELEILNLAVIPAQRRSGRGSELLRKTLAFAGSKGASRAFLDVREGNEAALGLYSRAGFAELYRRRGYYSDTGETAIVMALELKRTT